jgi:dipeptidyl aminopeptidase/acylaminoacyl peptidase
METAPAFSEEAATIASPASAEIAPAPIPTSVFAARSPFSSTPRLSPDGRRLVYSLKEDGKTFLGVFDIASGKLTGKWPLADEQELEWHRWAGNGRVLFSVSIPGKVLGIPVRVSRLLVVEIATGAGSMVGNQLGLGGESVLHVDPEGEHVLLSVRRALLDDPQVWRFRLDGTDEKGERMEVRRGVRHWITDDSGVVRVGLGYEGNKLKVYYRKSAADKLRLVARVRDGDKEELWDAVRLISGSDEGYVLEPGPSGRRALRRFNYATRELGEVVYENPDWDLNDFTLDHDGKPIAVEFTDDVDRVVWLDPAMAGLQRDFERALGEGEVLVFDVSRDESRMLVAQTSASDPGTLYIYTPAERHLEAFAQWRPDLDPAPLAPMKPIEYTARDGTKIRGYLTLPRGRGARNLPLVVMPHGGPFGVRDKQDYDDEVQLLTNRGYAVLQPNFRGSGGYGEPFEELGRGEIGRRMQDDLDDAVEWATTQGIADPQRVCLVGASYGGYAALWGVIRNPERYRCAASFAGVTAWDKQLKYDGDFFDRAGRRAWRERVRGEDRKFDLDSVSPARQAGLLGRPILLAHGKKDSNVPFEQFELMRNALRKVGGESAEYLVLENSGHGFADEKDEQAWYDALLAFLAKHNPAS